MDSDVDVTRWVLELLLRDRRKNTIAKRVLAVAPLPNHRGWRLKKSVLLQSIESAIHDDGSVTESVLEALEQIEALDRRRGFGTTAAMRAAYCAVATECTVKFLVCFGRKYLEAVDRIWRGRVRVLESERSELVSAELRERRSEVEAVIWDRSLSRKFERMNTRNDALRLVEEYVKEAWDSIGPPFVTLAVRFDMVKVVDGVGGGCGNEVRVLNGDNLRDGSKLEGNVVDGSKPEVAMKVASINGGDLGVGIESMGNRVNGTSVSDGSGVKAGMVKGGNVGGDRSKREAWRVKDATVATNVGGVTVAFPKFGYLLGYHKMDGILQVVGPGRSAPNVKCSVGKFEAAATEEKEIPMAVKIRHKHGLVKIRDAEYVGMGNMMKPVPAEVRKLQELESDVAALQAVLTNPLPYDFRVLERVPELEVNFVGRANPSLVKNTEHDHSYTDRHGILTSSDQNNIPKATGKEYDGSNSNSSVNKGKSTVHVRSGELYPGDLCCINQKTGPRPGLMERNSTADTYKWDDSLGMSPDGTVKGRIHDLPSPKGKAISSLKNEDKRLAKRRKV